MTDENDEKAVFLAALQGNVATLKPLMPDQANYSTPEGYTPLSLSVSAGHLEACRLLLVHGADTDAQDACGVSALMHACMHGYAEIVNLLLLHGASATLQNSQGQSSVSLAARYGRPAAIGTLFRADAALVRAQDGEGRTALHWAVCSEHIPTVKYLLGRWDADVNAIDNNGCSPLHLVGARIADESSQEDMVLLLFHGTSARPSLALLDHNGQTPAAAAAASGAHRAAVLLHAAGSVELEDPVLDSRRRAQLWSFLVHSPLRVPPKTRPTPSWLARASLPHALFALVPVAPPLALANGYSHVLALVACTMVLLLALYSTRACACLRRGANLPAYTINAAVLFGMVAWLKCC